MPFVEVEFSDLEFHETLGRGSAGSVYRAIWKSKEKVVAVKKLNLLESEAEVLSSLSHRNIVQFFGAVTVAPNFCIVTEYAELGCLYELLRLRTINFEQILQWAKEIALGMNYLHYEAPVAVIHRDLKSKNVVIASDLTAKLCDFGASRFHPHTTKLSLVGTFPWMAPEVIQQQPVTASCDVFSYSVVLWELLTHEVPYKGLEGLQVAWLVVAKEQRLTIPSTCPPVFADLMRHCWAQQPSQRLTFKEILVELDNIINNDKVQEETDFFLGQKSTWKIEIEEKLEELKLMETALSSREQELKKKEQALVAREKHLESISSRTRESAQNNQEGHDAEHWGENEVVDWFFGLGNDQLSHYAILFEEHHINGRSLFLLTMEDLLQMGVHSLGHRKELMEKIEKLKQDNYRLLHFPPLEQPKSPSRPFPLEPITENITIIFCCICRKGLSPQDHKWKYLVDFDSVHYLGYVDTVQFVFSSSIPSDIITLSQSPFLTPKWREGPCPPQLECIINYKPKVQRPRETHYQLVPHEESSTEELCAKLVLDPRNASTPYHPHPPTPPFSKKDPQSPNSPSTPIFRNTSSPQLSGAWATRSQVIRPLPSSPSAGTLKAVHGRPGQQPHPQVGRVGQGAWANPGSGAAVVRSQARASGGGMQAKRPLLHSMSGPLPHNNHPPSYRGRQRPISMTGTVLFEEGSPDPAEESHDQSRDSSSSKHVAQHRWKGKDVPRDGGGDCRVPSSGEAYQRSSSTTQAKPAQQRRNRQSGRQQRTKASSEPLAGGNSRPTNP